MNDLKNTSISKKTDLRQKRRLARVFLVSVLILAACMIGLLFPKSSLADAGGWPSPTFIIIPTLINFPTATLFPTVDLSNLNQLMITEPTPTPTMFIAPTPLPSGGGSVLGSLCLPLGIGFIVIMILAFLVIMRRRQI